MDNYIKFPGYRYDDDLDDCVTVYTNNTRNRLIKGEKDDGQSSTYTYNALSVRIKNVQVRVNVNKGYANSDQDNGSDNMEKYAMRWLMVAVPSRVRGRTRLGLSTRTTMYPSVPLQK